MVTFVARALAASLLTLVAAKASAGDGIDTLIARAEASRSSDPAAFVKTLGELDARLPYAKLEQRQRARLLHAYAEAFRGRYDLAILQARPLADADPNDEVRLRAALLLSNSAAVDRQFSLALKYLELGLELVNSRPYSSELRQNAFYVAAMLYGQLEKFDLSQRFAEQMLAEQASPRSQCAGKQIRLEALAGIGRLPADSEVDTAITQCLAIHEPVFANLVRTYLARKWAGDGRRREAVQLLDAHIGEIERTGFPILIAEAHSLLARYKAALGDPAAATHAQRVLRLTNVIPFTAPRVSAFKVLYEQAQRQGDFAAALRFYKDFSDASRASINEAGARELAFQQSRNELQQKNYDIALLSRQNDVLRLEHQVAKTSSQNTRLLIALLTLLLAGGVLWALRARRMHHSLRRLADTDGLTGISNRRHFRVQAEAALAACAVRAQPAAMLLFDLDHFKAINDRHGHAAGDWVLTEVTRCCAALCRKGDLFGRMGGEEFAIALFDCDLATAHTIADSLRRCIESIDPVDIGREFKVTASFGCAGSALSGHAYEALCAHADVALYRAKHAGRNRISVHDGRAVTDAAPASATEEADCAPCEALHQSAEA